MSEVIVKEEGKQENTFLYSQHACQGRILIKELLKDDKGASRVGETVTIGGWVKTGRNQAKGAFAFVHISDGSTIQTLQVLIDSTLIDLKQVLPTGTGLAVRGELVASPGENQAVELKATEILFVGACDAKTFPLAKKAHTLEYLRAQAHFRPRSNLFSCIFRIRNALSYATHKFFQDRQFVYAHTPLITASDCEGAGEMFQITNLLPGKDKVVKDFEGPSEAEFAALESAITENGKIVADLKASGGTKEEIGAAVKNLVKSKEDLKKLQSTPIKIGGVPFSQDRKVDYSQDFFGVPSHLTVSGQLQAETFACALSNTYTFGPTFRAEKSLTSRHLAEFWMIEPEVAFADLFDIMQLAEDYVKFCCDHVIKNNLEDLEFIDKWHELDEKQKEKDKVENKRQFSDTSVERVSNIVKNTFKRISYTEAIDILLNSGVKFVEPVSWGIDLSSEHERYIAEKVFNCPTIVYNYPRDIKAFYMRQNEDGKTVSAMDILVPQIGELIGGSQREERFDVLSNRIKELGMDVQDFWWYLDLRKFGTVIHSGFGLGFERLIMFVTGMENIRDVIPFPRTQLSVNF